MSISIATVISMSRVRIFMKVMVDCCYLYCLSYNYCCLMYLYLISIPMYAPRPNAVAPA